MATVTTKNETDIRGDFLGQAIDDVLAEWNTPPTSATAKPISPNAIPETVPVRKQTSRDDQRVAYQPSPRTYMSPLRQSTRTDWVDVMLKVWLTCGLACLVALLAFAFPWSPFHRSANRIPIIREFAGARTKPIQDVRVGERLVGRNPIREQVDGVEPDPVTWRKISLYMTKESGLGLWIDLLRPLTWIEEYDAKLGSTILIDLYEMGAVGDAEVTFLGPCPSIQPGKGTVVTGTFKHQADRNTNVVNLKLEDQIELTGVTDNHPYWSVDRQDFVQVGKLRIDELVDTEYGLKHVVSITPIAHNGYLYNLETTEHVYRVGSLATLVHNSCPGVAFHGTDIDSAKYFLKGGKLDAAIAAAKKLDGPPGFFLATHVDDALAFGVRRGRGTVLEFRFSQAAREQLEAAGMLRQRIPGGPNSLRTIGDELIVRPDAFDVFNRLLELGEITVRPGRF